MLLCDAPGCKQDARRFRVMFAEVFSAESRSASDFADIDLCDSHAKALFEGICDVISRYHKPVTDPIPLAIPPDPTPRGKRKR
jgi:hypothetical protein